MTGIGSGVPAPAQAAQAGKAAGSDVLNGRRSLVLLGAGALAGVVLAAVGLQRPASDALPSNAIARVNDRVIRSETYEQLWRAVASDKRNPMTDMDRAHVLKRLIEEELLIQRGEAIGLVASDAAVRKAISVAMLQSIVAESEALQPEDAELRAFYRENQAFFAPPPTLQVRQLVFRPRSGESPDDARGRARAARKAIAQGASLTEAGERYADVPFLAIPDAPLPVNKLRQYIGPTLVERAYALQALEVSEPIEVESGLRIFQRVDASVPEVLSFEAVRERVESAFLRDAGDRALREYFDSLWREADIALAPDAPKGLEAPGR